MKKTILKSVVATAVVAATMAVSSVATFAAKVSHEYYYGHNDNYFTVSANPVNKASSLIDDLSSLPEDFTDAIKMESSTNIGFTTNANTATVTILWAPKAGATGDRCFEFDDNKIPSVTGPVTTLQTFTKDVSAGPHTIKKGKGTSDTYIYYIKVEDEEDDNSHTYTITGEADVPNDTVLTIDGNNEVTVTDKQWKYTKSGATMPYENNATVTITSNAYKDTTATLSYNEATFTYTATGATFVKKDLVPLEEGEYDYKVIGKGFPNFDNTNAKSIVEESVKPGNGEYILFNVKSNATVTVEYKCGSTASGNKAQITLTNGETKVDGPESLTPDDGNGKGTPPTVTLKAENLTGDCKLTSVTNKSTQILKITVTYPQTKDIASTKAAIGTDYYAVDTKNGKTYIIHPVKTEEMEYTSLALQGRDNAKLAPTKTVYTSVKFSDDSEITADSIGAKALYAVLVSDSEGAAPTKAFTWVEAN